MTALNQIWKLATGILTLPIRALGWSITSLLPSCDARCLKKLAPIVEAINALEPHCREMTDLELKEQTAKFRQRLAVGETLDDLLVEAFAACREAGRRALDMRHHDVQLMGGIVIHSGMIAEIGGSEGKTLVVTLPAYLNALQGRGVHVVTASDAMAQRTCQSMQPLYLSLGISVGFIQSNMASSQRQRAYGRDATYGSCSEFGFDYLRNNMRPAAKGDDRFAAEFQQCQGRLHCAIIDDIDTVLIDEARTPLIICGPSQNDQAPCAEADRIARKLKREVHFQVYEKDHTVRITDEGLWEAERLAGVESFYVADNVQWPRLINKALEAHYLYHRDVHYLVRSGEIVIVDESTGQPQPGHTCVLVQPDIEFRRV